MAAPTFVAARRQTALPWDVQSAGTIVKTTPSFSVTAGQPLAVLAGAEDGQYTFTAISGGGLTWTKQEDIGTASASARATLWTTTATATTSITVTVTVSDSAAMWGFVVHQYDTDGSIGAHTSVLGSASTAPSLALTTTAANSAISYLHTDWSSSNGTTRTWRTINSITPTSGNGLETDYFRDSGGTRYAVYAGYWSDVGAAGSKTTGLTAPSTQQPAIVVVEILGSGPPAPFDPSYIDWPLRQPHPKMRGAA
jgi:hypothetical protein